MQYVIKTIRYLLTCLILVLGIWGLQQPAYAAPDKELFQQINNFRIQYEVPKTIYDPYLAKLADQKAQEMAKYDYIEHTWNGVTFGMRVKPYFELAHATAAGENLAAGYKTEYDTVWQGWRYSTAGHKENMIDTKWKYMGTARALNPDGKFGTYDVMIAGDVPGFKAIPTYSVMIPTGINNYSIIKTQMERLSGYRMYIDSKYRIGATGTWKSTNVIKQLSENNLRYKAYIAQSRNVYELVDGTYVK